MRVRFLAMVGCVLGLGAGAAAMAPKALPLATQATASAPAVTKPQVERRLKVWRRQLGGLTPKSLVASSAGRVFAQNMIYNHSVTVFDSDGNRITDISDRIPRALLGLPDDTLSKPSKPSKPGAARKPPAFVRGAPVEAAVTRDGRTLYVSNYYILGQGFPGNVTDKCELEKKLPSYVYEIDVETYAVRRTHQVGSTPKFLALTADERSLLVSNWCDASVSVVDLSGTRATATVRVGSFPRGIAIEPDGKTAYVTTMGRLGIAVVDLEKMTVTRRLNPGRGPRHLLLTAAGELLASLSHEASVVVVDKDSGEALARVRTGKDPRSMALSSDGTALYVGNYGEDSLSVVDVDAMKVVQKIATGPHPIGVAFEPTRERVWVSCYGGSVRLYDTRGTPPHPSARKIADEAKRFPP